MIRTGSHDRLRRMILMVKEKKSNVVFIKVNKGESDAEYRSILSKAKLYVELSNSSIVEDLKKDDKAIGKLYMGLIYSESKTKVRGFICGELWYDDGKAIYLDETSDSWTRFSIGDEPLNTSMDEFIMLILYNKFKSDDGLFGQLVQEKYFPDWEEHKRELERIEYEKEREREMEAYEELFSQIGDYWLIRELTKRGYKVTASEQLSMSDGLIKRFNKLPGIL